MPDEIQIGWNAIAGRYYDLATGRFVKFVEVGVAIEDVVIETRAGMSALTDKLIASEISLAEWQGGMMDLIKRGNNLSAIAARGGVWQMSPSDWGAVGNLTKEQYKYLRNFAEEISSGKQPLNGSARVRAQLYADAVANQFENLLRRNEEIYQKMTEERRVVNPDAEHCQTHGDLIGCEELAKMGWQPIGTLPPIGHSPCIVKCRCHFEFRKGK